MKTLFALLITISITGYSQCSLPVDACNLSESLIDTIKVLSHSIDSVGIVYYRKLEISFPKNYKKIYCYKTINEKITFYPFVLNDTTLSWNYERCDIIVKNKMLNIDVKYTICIILDDNTFITYGFRHINKK